MRSKKFICVLTVILLTVVMLPLFEASAESEISSGQAILNLDYNEPLEFDKYDTNVYGTGNEDKTPFLLSEHNELFFLRADTKSRDAYIYDDISMASEHISDGIATVKTPNRANATETMTDIDDGAWGSDGNFCYVQAIGFDPTGSGRKDHVAMIGYSKDSQTFDVIVKNLKTDAIASLSLTKAAWIKANKDPHPFEVANYLSITAGDYDNDGKDTVLVYTVGDSGSSDYHGQAIIREIRYNGSSCSATQVIDLADYLVYKEWQTKNDTKRQPTVTLTTGDFNGDGIDEFAYTAGFFNAEGDKNGYTGTNFKGMENFASYIQMVDGSSGSWIKTDPVWMYERSDSYTQSGNKKTYKYTVMQAASITAADTDGDGVDEVVAAGYTTNDTLKVEFVDDEWSKVTHICDWEKNSYVTSVVSRTKSGCQKTQLTSLAMSKFFANNFGTDGYNDKRNVFPKIIMAAGRTNGGKASEDVFISGILYSFEGGAGSEVFTPTIMTQTFSKVMLSFISSEVQFVGNVAVGNFDGNNAGREQFVYTLWFMESGEHKYNHVFLDIIGGSVYEDTVEDGEIKDFGSAKYYGQGSLYDGQGSFIWSGKEKASKTTQNVRQEAVSVPVAVDVDNDGLLAKYEGSYYAYSDPEVIAVLQAAPYFDELGNAGATSYTIANGYGRTNSHGWEIEFGVGFAGEVQIGNFKTGLELGVTNSFSKNYSDSYTVEQSSTIEAGDKSVVVITRIPIMIYSYLLENPNTKQWTDHYTVSVPLTPTMFSLTIDEYNDFVDLYNEKTGADTPKLIKILTDGTDLPSDHEGDPFNYWKGWGECGGTMLSNNSFHLDKSGTTSSSEWSYETEYEEEYEHSHGLHFSLTIQGGISGGTTFGQVETWLGGYAELDSSWSFGLTKTTFSSKTASGSVTNLSPDDPPYYDFYWDFGTWSRTLSEAKDAVDVPFYGYHVYDVKAMALPVTDLKAEFDQTEDNETIIRLTWSDPGTDKRPVEKYVLYQYQADGTKNKIAELPAGITEYIFDRVDGRDHYEFEIATIGNGFATSSQESISAAKAYLYVSFRSILSIEKTGTDGVNDIYTIYYSDDTTSEIRVSNGVSIEDISLTSSDGLEDTYTIKFTDGSKCTYVVKNGADGNGIESIEKTSTDGLVDVYTVTMTDGQKYEIRITNGKDGLDGRSAYDLAVENGYQGTLAEWIASLKGNGIGIKSIEKTSSEGNIDTYTIEYTDGSIQTFTVSNGTDGRGIVSCEKVKTEGNIDTYLITYTDGTKSEFTVSNGLSAYDIAVAQTGFTGSPAEWVASLTGSGIGVEKIEKTGTSEDGLIDTYTIYYTDSSSYTFTVTNGKKGDTGDQGVGIREMKLIGSDPENNLIDIYQIILTNDEIYELRVCNGAAGAEGKSAYDIAVENGFEGTAAQWIASLAGNGIGVDRIEKTSTSEDGVIDTYTIYYTDGSSYRFTVTNGVGIEEIILLGSKDNIDTYQIRMTDGSSYSFAVKNGVDGVGVEKVEKTSTSEDGLVDTYTITLTDGRTYSYQLVNGKDGVGVESIRMKSSFGNVDTYVITLTNGSKTEFTVRNGTDGEAGKSAYELAVENGYKGSILKWLADLAGEGVHIIAIEDERIDELQTKYIFRYSDGTTYSFIVTDGKDGEAGKDGRSVVSISKTGSEGLTDTYTITYSDGAESTFTVNNGEKGETGAAGKDGRDGVRILSIDGSGNSGTYTIRYSDGNSGSFRVPNGQNGTNGKDGVGIRDVKINEAGEQIVTLTDGTTINSGKPQITTVMSNSKVTLTKCGAVSSYFFNVPYDDFKTLEISGKQLALDKYSVSQYGDGVLVTISDDAIPRNGKIKAVGTVNSEIASISTPVMKTPLWLIAALAVLGVAVTLEGIQIVRLSRR